MLKLFFTGNLLADPKTSTTKNGKQVCNFDVAVRGSKYFNTVGGKKDDEKTLYVQVSVFGGLAGTCARFLTKGRTVTVDADQPEFSIYKSEKYGDMRLSVHVIGNDVEFGNNATRPPVPENAGEAPQKEPDRNFVPEGFVEVSPEELPF